VINAKGELVGLIFDGNIQSLPGYFIYDQAVNRSVSVDARGMLEALRVVYKANWIADELVGANANKTAVRWRLEGEGFRRRRFRGPSDSSAGSVC
jgi:hypothetical protein